MYRKPRWWQPSRLLYEAYPRTTDSESTRQMRCQLGATLPDVALRGLAGVASMYQCAVTAEQYPILGAIAGVAGTLAMLGATDSYVDACKLAYDAHKSEPYAGACQSFMALDDIPPSASPEQIS